MNAIHLKIFGRVQGVYYRQSAADKAISLSLTGFVRNCADGSVEVVAEGNTKDLDLMIAWCGKGPPAAMVERIEIERREADHTFKTFQIL